MLIDYKDVKLLAAWVWVHFQIFTFNTVKSALVMKIDQIKANGEYLFKQVCGKLVENTRVENSWESKLIVELKAKSLKINWNREKESKKLN